MSDKLNIGKHSFNSRLIIGTGKYESLQQTANAVKASGAEIVTVAVRRVNIENNGNEKLQDYVNPKEIMYLPNTAGCFTAKDAIRVLSLAREAGGWNLVKLEVLGDKKTLYPDMYETLEAAKILIADNFEVMVYTNDDPIYAKKLEDIGCCAIMPLAAPIGSGLGMQNRLNLQLILQQSSVPVLVDAGVGVPSDAAIPMEMGADGILMNTAIAESQNPILMAEAMKNAVIAGRQAFLAGRMPIRNYGSPSSPITGIVGS